MVEGTDFAVSLEFCFECIETEAKFADVEAV
jgi:hypothetical protein